MLVQVFKGAAATAMALDILGFLRGRRHDAMIHGRAEFGGAIAAQSPGVPNVAIATCVTFGIPPDPMDRRQLANLYPDTTPPSFHVFEALDEIPTKRSLRYGIYKEVPSDIHISPFEAAIPHPFAAYVTLDTVFRDAQVTANVLEALESLPLNVIVTGDGIEQWPRKRAGFVSSTYFAQSQFSPAWTSLLVMQGSIQ
jgi:hypothetical protein